MMAMVLGRAAQVAIVGSVVLAAVHFAKADTPTAVCHVIELEFLPTDRLQIVAWITDTNGVYVDTVFITQQTGTFGLGNRPGRFDFNSGPNWPYGRRITTFPVWSHANGRSFATVIFQNDASEDPNACLPPPIPN